MRWNTPHRVVIGGLLLAAALLVTSSATANEQDGLVIGLIPEMNVFEQVERYQGLAEYLSERLNRPVRLTMLSRYGNIVERILNKEVDAAFLGSFTGALVTAQLGWKPIARPINADDSSTYWGYIFVRKDSGITEVAQMRGQRMAFVERATTAGYIFPVAYFKERGVDDVEEYFAEVQFWGSHDSSINAVLEGRANVGAAKNTIWERMSRQDPRIESELLILATSPKVPSNGLLVSPEVESQTRIQLREILLGLGGDPTSDEVLGRLGVKGFVPTDKGSYQAVFELSEEAGIDLNSYSYDNQ